MKEIYFDNAATTRIHPNVSEDIRDAEENHFYNSAALYSGSVKTNKVLDEAKQTIMRRLTREESGILVITSGATEGNNIVIFGKMTSPGRHHMVVLAGEHSSTYAPSVHLKNAGFAVDYVPLTISGEADINALASVIRPTTTLVVFGLVNSDTGTIQPAREIIKTVRGIAPKAHIHCDAVQGFAKFDFDVSGLGFDSAVVSAHKIYGPKGVGALWLKKNTKLSPIMYGGSQQDFRPGTENNAGIIGLGSAIRNFDTAKNFAHVQELHDTLIKGLPTGCSVNGKNTNPYITNIMLPGILGQTAMNYLSSRGIYVGLGSACAAKASKNRTLIAMGIPEAKTKNVLRISFGIYNSVAEVDIFLSELDRLCRNPAFSTARR